MRAKLDVEQYLRDLEHLVNIDSHTADPEGVEAVAGFFERAFAEAGWSVKRVDIGTGAGPCLEATNGQPPYDALLLGHMDTVFPKGTVSDRPYSRDGDRAFGPGVVDMKSGLLFALYAARELTATGAAGSFCIAFNSEEETGSTSARPWIERLARESRSSIVLEPARASGNLVNQRKGIGHIHAVFHGRAAHAGVEPEKGASAVNEMARWIIELNELANVDRGTTLNTGLVSGGTGANVVPEVASITVDVRVRSLDEADRIAARIEEMKARPFTPGVSVDAGLVMTRPPMNPDAGTQRLCALVEEAAGEAGVEFGWQATGGGSDGNFTAALGVPTVDGMGPVGGRSHSVDEYLDLASLPSRFDMLMGVLARIPGSEV